MKQHIKAFMIDAARQPESLAASKRIVDYCHAWGFNTIVFRLADDQGLAADIGFKEPLARHPDAWTKRELQDFIAYAGKFGIDVVPELESFGHTRFITSTPAFKKLVDSAEGNPHGFNGLCPVHPETLPLLDRLYECASKLFPSRYLHVGCDEVSWGGSKLSKAAIERKGRAAIWTEYINSLRKSAAKHGKEIWIWGDHVLRKEPEILKGLDKRVVIVDWDYWTENPDDLKKRAETAIEAGFRVIGAPALLWCKWGPRPGSAQLKNIDAFSEAYKDLDDSKRLGFLLTNWCPWRYLADSHVDVMAYASTSFDGGTAKARDEGFKLFVERTYGCEWNDAWAALFNEALNLVRPRKGCARANDYPFLPAAWFNEDRLVDALDLASRQSLPDFSRLSELLNQCEDEVAENPRVFKAFRDSFECLKTLYWRIAVLRRANAKNAASIIKRIAEKDAETAAKLSSIWNGDRRSDSPCRGDGEKKPDERLEVNGEDHLLPMAFKAARYSAALAKRPKEFLEILEKTRKAKNSAAKKKSSVA